MINHNKMTAVEQMLKELQENFPKQMADMYDSNQLLLEDIALKAKKMEKEQSNAKIQKAIEVFEEAKSKAITIKDMFYYLDIVLVALEGIKNETFKPE